MGMLAAAFDDITESSGARHHDSLDAATALRLEELAIAERAREHPAAFAPLYERYVDAIFGYCYRRTSDRELAADLTHQVFDRALTAMPRFAARPGTGSFRSWLFTIAHNLVVDTHRLRKETTSIDRMHDLRDQAITPEDHAIASEQQRVLRDAMDSLTDGQRQVVELRLAGLTGPEIAETLGLRLEAVKSTQFRAYGRLRAILSEAFMTGRTPGDA
ncbi:MAG TPA: sigma-70 family RNA polymerase sigma factor [Thermomicrobiales bacterium]|nr:sigma-70 family RNA polymerase sigma factor [Thermomicrobiales bacterium]